MTAPMIFYLLAIITAGALAQSLPNPDGNNTEAVSDPNTNSSVPFYTEIPPPSTPPKPPACGLQTQICIQILPPAYAAPKAGQLPRPLEDAGCTISYTGDNGALVYPQITALEKRGHLIEGEAEEDDPPVPCGLNIAMKLEGSSYGPFEVEYQKNLNGLPGDPVFRYVIPDVR